MQEGEIHRISELLGLEIRAVHQLHGGDINRVYLLDTSAGKQVLKLQSSPISGMFPAEAKGLNTLAQCKAFRIPEVIHCTEEFLILEYLEPGGVADDEKTGQALAALHRITSDNFGFEEDNFLGSLPQSNTFQENAVDFFREERLIPQLDLAAKRGFTFRGVSDLLNNLDNLIPSEPASLIHGDLWNGNFMTDTMGNPCLIDPAVSFAPREMDLAMMSLFGGFSNRVFRAYTEAFPLAPGFEQRKELWQLYYILAHLNLFGSSYYGASQRIIDKYA